MTDFTDIILKYRSGEMTKVEKEEFKRNLSLDEQFRKEYIFQEKIDKIMKQSLLLDSIESDPDLIRAEILARKDIDTYLSKDVRKKEKKSFELGAEVELQKKVAKAEVEMVLSGIDDISEVWVRNFEQTKPALKHHVAAQRIMGYIQESDPFNETAPVKRNIIHRFSRKVVIQVAAAALLLSLLLFKSLTPSYTGDFVYSRYYEPLAANSYRLRGNSNEVGGKLQEGVDYYLLKEYSKAEQAFNESRKMNENLPEVLLFSGLNHMGQNNFPAAIASFTDLLSAEDQFIPEAQWYLGLCYIKTGETLKARSLMETLSGTEGIYKKKAQLILKNLSR
jgi:tetratricopeptide (TPR) repeat protein